MKSMESWIDGTNRDQFSFALYCIDGPHPRNVLQVCPFHSMSECLPLSELIATANMSASENVAATARSAFEAHTLMRGGYKMLSFVNSLSYL